MITHIQICTENQNGDRPVIYDGEFGETDFINRDVIMGELVQNLLKTAKECEVIQENLNASVDKGQKIVIKYWKENKKAK
jgi:hypothetical protein